jgi:hypothetical protein
MTSDNTLPASLKLLNDSDGSFHVCIEGDPIMNLFYFFAGSDLSDNFFNGKISSIFGIVDEARERDFEGFGGEFHVHEDLIDIDEIGLDDVCVSGVADNVLLDFAHSDHSVVKHLFHENSSLRMNHLIVSFFEFAIGIEVSKVKCGIVLKPFQI